MPDQRINGGAGILGLITFCSCARCRAQVLLCSRCDRGQRYCSQACSFAARRE